MEGSLQCAKVEVGDREAGGCPYDPENKGEPTQLGPVLTPDLGGGVPRDLAPVNAVTNCQEFKTTRGAWVAQLVKQLTLGFDSGHDVNSL